MPDNAMPDVKYRCANKYTMIIGTMAMVAAAIM